MDQCIVVRDGFGDTHAVQLAPDESPIDAAKALVHAYGLDDHHGERFEFGIANVKDPGAARLQWYAVHSKGSFEL